MAMRVRAPDPSDTGMALGAALLCTGVALAAGAAAAVILAGLLILAASYLTGRAS